MSLYEISNKAFSLKTCGIIKTKLIIFHLSPIIFTFSRKDSKPQPQNLSMDTRDVEPFVEHVLSSWTLELTL